MLVTFHFLLEYEYKTFLGPLLLFITVDVASFVKVLFLGSNSTLYAECHILNDDIAYCVRYVILKYTFKFVIFILNHEIIEMDPL